MSACARVCSVSVLDADSASASSSFFTETHHGSIVLGVPANHMSGLVMFMPSHINQIGLTIIYKCNISEDK